MQKGILYVVPTPIGNLGDITLRALEVLKLADKIYCEDTRVTGKLMQFYDIKKPLKSLHQNNEHYAIPKIAEEIEQNNISVYCSDAGTPGISDPGFMLIRYCIEAGIKVECLPGATALIPALVVSGLPCDKFVFEGFLPHKKGRETKIKALMDESRTIVLYESTHRIHKTIEQIKSFFGNDRKVVIVRELTKMFEEIIRGSFLEVSELIKDKELKGEIVIVIEGKNA